VHTEGAMKKPRRHCIYGGKSFNAFSVFLFLGTVFLIQKIYPRMAGRQAGGGSVDIFKAYGVFDTRMEHLITYLSF